MQKTQNVFADDHDLQFHFKHFPWQNLAAEMTHLSEEDRKSLAENAFSVMDSIGSYVAKEALPRVAELRDQRPSLKDGVVIEAPLMKLIMNGLGDLGAMGASLAPAFGGMGLPLIVVQGTTQLLSRADISLGNVFAYHAGAVKFIEQFDGEGGVDFASFGEAAAAGRDFGAMCLTEPQAGSDLSQVRTRGEFDKKENMWRVNGQKIWITCGHAGHHFVLARTGSPESGLQGLSLFYVPAQYKGQRNLQVTGLEEKVGHHPVVTATIHYDKSFAYLMGAEGEGFQQMLHVMNHARNATACISLGSCEAVLRIAEDFAKERVTMGQTIDKHPMIAEYLEDMRVTVQALRALLFKCLYHEDMEYRMRLKIKREGSNLETEKRLKHHSWQGRLLTPLSKYFGSEESIRLSRMSMQILGGSGYMKEFEVGNFHQDALLLAIYEGTSQIQSLMNLKDRMSRILKSPKAFVQEIAKTQLALLSEKSHSLEASMAQLKHSYLKTIQIFVMEALSKKVKSIESFSWAEISKLWREHMDPKKELEFAQKHAERFTKITCYYELGRCLVDAIEVADESEKEERRKIAETFMKHYVIRSKNTLEEIRDSAEGLPSATSSLSFLKGLRPWDSAKEVRAS